MNPSTTDEPTMVSTETTNNSTDVQLTTTEPLKTTDCSVRGGETVSLSESESEGTISEDSEHGSEDDDQRDEDASTPPRPTAQHKTSSTIAFPKPLPRGIIKRCESEQLHIKTNRRSWKCLSPPDMNMVRQRSTRTLGASSDHSNATWDLNNSDRPPRRGSVGFKEIQIREYDQTLGDNPSVSYGPPISLDWEYTEKTPVDLDDFESHRGERRSLREMQMNYYHRKNTLMWKIGHSDDELKKATKEVSKQQFQRGVTKYFLRMSKLEEAAQSAARKAKRLTSRKRNTSV